MIMYLWPTEHIKTNSSVTWTLTVFTCTKGFELYMQSGYSHPFYKSWTPGWKGPVWIFDWYSLKQVTSRATACQQPQPRAASHWPTSCRLLVNTAQFTTYKYITDCFWTFWVNECLLWQWKWDREKTGISKQLMKRPKHTELQFHSCIKKAF